MASATSTIDRLRARGLTLIEGLFASAILGLAVVGIFAPISASYQHAEAAEHSSLAVTLARQLLDEISSKPFDDPEGSTAIGPDPGEKTRALFDNIDDYHGFSDSTAPDAADSLRTTAGVAVLLDSHGTFMRRVTAEYRAVPQGPAVVTGHLLLVTVRVDLPDGANIALHRLFTRYPRSGIQ